MKRRAGIVTLFGMGAAVCGVVGLGWKWQMALLSSTPTLSNINSVAVPFQGTYRWMPTGLLEITIPRKRRVLWNPSTGNTIAAEPLPLPPGITTDDTDRLRWSFSKDNNWVLITQTLFQQRDRHEGLWPTAQRTWLLDAQGRVVSSPQPSYEPIESDILWARDSAYWVTTTPTTLFIRAITGRVTRVPLPALASEHWHRTPCAFLPDGRVLLAESYQEVPEGVSFTPLERLRFRTVDCAPPYRASVPTDFPLLAGSATRPMSVVTAGVSPDGAYVLIGYSVSTVAPGQHIWGRFIAGPEPREPHSELWVSRRDGSAAKCLLSSPEAWTDIGWHPDSKRVLLEGTTARVIRAVP